MTNTYCCEPAVIDWQDGAPFSGTYQDIYWNRESGPSEKQTVFVDPVRSMIGHPTSGQFTVCELGFGFGLNCLLTAEFWSGLPRGCWLNLVSVENHPVPAETLSDFLKQHNFRFTSALLAQYPPPIRGQHVIWLAPNIRLLLILDEAETALSGLDAEIDFWYLDGFAPARNDAMWQSGLLKKMFARSRPGARIATYSAAGTVKRGLESAGFLSEKVKGFGAKKEMLTANKPGEWKIAAHHISDVTIIGGGLAGLFCSEALNKRGIDCQVIDNDGPKASMIPQLAVKPQLALHPEARYRFSLMANQYMQHAPGFYRSGVAWLGKDSQEQERISHISAQFPDTFMSENSAGTTTLHSAGWLSFDDMASSLSVSRMQDDITALNGEGTHWTLTTKQGRYETSNVILATGAAQNLLHPSLEIRAVHGQSISIPTSDVDVVINDAISILPTTAGRSIVSGTYARRATLDVDPADTAELVAGASKFLNFEPEDAIPHTAVRAVSRDRLPLVGPSPDWQRLAGYADRPSALKETLNGLYYCTAFGSRGATHARLCAEQLVSKMLKEPSALDLKQQFMLSPARFYLRDN